LHASSDGHVHLVYDGLRAAESKPHLYHLTLDLGGSLLSARDLGERAAPPVLTRILRSPAGSLCFAGVYLSGPDQARFEATILPLQGSDTPGEEEQVLVDPWLFAHAVRFGGGSPRWEGPAGPPP
jgi:hypothetical protein